MRKTILEASSKEKVVKALGIELDIDITKVKVLINGIDISDQIKLKKLEVVADLVE